MLNHKHACASVYHHHTVTLSLTIKGESLRFTFMCIGCKNLQISVCSLVAFKHSRVKFTHYTQCYANKDSPESLCIGKTLGTMFLEVGQSNTWWRLTNSEDQGYS